MTEPTWPTFRKYAILTAEIALVAGILLLLVLTWLPALVGPHPGPAGPR